MYHIEKFLGAQIFEDPIVEKIRKIRHAHAAKFNNDPAAICEDLRRMERGSGRTHVSFPANRLATVTVFRIRNTLRSHHGIIQP